MSVINDISSILKKNRYLTAIIFFILMAIISLGGVSAWMSGFSGSVVNTFEPSKVIITLEETDTGIDDDDDKNTNSYEITPGEEGWEEISKDPKVTVPEGTADCWVFVSVEEINDFSHYMTYEIDNGWHELEGETGIYWRKSFESPESQDFNILKDKTVSVKDTVTKGEINALTENNYPKLKITGFALQLVGFDTAEDAWEFLNQNGSD